MLLKRNNLACQLPDLPDLPQQTEATGLEGEPLLAGIRAMEPEDYHRGYQELFSALTSCLPLSEEQFCQVLAERKAGAWYTWVVPAAPTDSRAGRLIATISLHLERKFYRNGRCVGHIEDLIVLPEYQRHNLGRGLMQFAVSQSRALHCYKVILDCAEGLRDFYAKTGLRYSNIQMASYF